MPRSVAVLAWSIAGAMEALAWAGLSANITDDVPSAQELTQSTDSHLSGPAGQREVDHLRVIVVGGRGARPSGGRGGDDPRHGAGAHPV